MTSKEFDKTKANLEQLNFDLDIARMKMQHEKENISQEVYDEREKYREQQYAINGEYYYDRKQQNADFETLKLLYRKNVTNFHILNSSLKEIIYHFPDRKETIQNMVKEEQENLRLGGNNSYRNKLYRLIMDGKTVNENEKDNLYYRELALPKRYNDENDIKNDELFSLPFQSKKNKYTPY